MSNQKNIQITMSDKLYDDLTQIEAENFCKVYGNPSFIKSDNGQGIVCMSIEYYERITGEKIDFSREI